MPCETCHAALGFPYVASTLHGAPNRIRIDLRCRGCGAEWSVEALSDSGVFRLIDDEGAKR